MRKTFVVFVLSVVTLASAYATDHPTPPTPGGREVRPMPELPLERLIVPKKGKPTPFIAQSWGGGYSPVKKATLQVHKSGLATHLTEWHAFSGKAGKVSVEHKWQFLAKDLDELKSAVKKSGICDIKNGTVFGMGMAIVMDAGVTTITAHLPNCNVTVQYNPASGKPKRPEGIVALQAKLSKVTETVTSRVLGMPDTCKKD